MRIALAALLLAATLSAADDPVTHLHCGPQGEAVVCTKSVTVRDLGSIPAKMGTPGPVYPPELLAASVEGTATVAFVIQSDSSTDGVVVLNVGPEGADAFGDAVAEAVRQFRFKPPVHDGKPVAVREVAIRMVFRPADWVDVGVGPVRRQTPDS